MPPTRIHLPEPAASFIGRTAALTALSRLVDAARIVTILGPPGVGKTRLASRFVGLVGERYPAGALFCDLTETTDALGVCAALARVLDLPIGSASWDDVVLSLAKALDAGGPRLVVLDNFEQLVEHAGDVVDTWARSAPRTRFVVTSRRRLSVPGEALLDLAPLELPEGDDVEGSEAGQLFLDRARLVRRDYALAPEDAPIVATLLRELDGLPLAIELCAARMRVLSPPQLLEKMERRFQLLSDPRASPEPRRGFDLRQTIEASWALLAAPEQAALAQGSVFRGGFDLTAAEAVIDLGPEAPWTLDVLERLVDRSLLRANPGAAGGPRFSLYLTIREFASVELARNGGENGAVRRHASYYLGAGEGWAERASGPDALAARRWLEAEFENLVAVHRRALGESRAQSVQGPLGRTAAARAALAIAPVLEARGPFAVAESLLREALEGADDSMNDAIRGATLVALGRILRRMGRFVECETMLGRARELAARGADRALLARVLLELAVPMQLRGRWRESREQLEQARAIWTELGDRRGQAASLFRLGQSFLYEDDLEGAGAWHGRALDAYRDIGDRLGEASALNSMAIVEMQRGQSNAARELFGEALHIFRTVGERHLACAALGQLAILEQDAGCLDRALDRYREAIEGSRELGNAYLEALLVGRLGTCLHERGRLDEALALLEEGVVRADELGVAVLRADFRACLGVLLADRGETDRPATLFDAADDLASDIREQRHVVHAIRVRRAHLELALARVSAARGDSVRAGELRQAARQRLAEAPPAGERGTDERLAVRLLERAFVSEPSLAREEGFSPELLLVEASGAWFRPPHGRRVPLEDRRPLRELLGELGRQRRDRPGSAASGDDLIRRVWPDEAMGSKVTANRLYVAISTLRKLGLHKVLRTASGGYLLDPEVPFELVS